MNTSATTARPTSAAAPEEVFQALADSTRLRCLALIVTHGELCVCELVHALELSQPKISRHLKLLRETGLVADRRERIWVHYRLADTLPSWARSTLNDVVAAHAQDAPFADDARRLAHMPDRPDGRCNN
ncbi:metalloregulator ArsR/SmtB family transcription factor [Salinisphaera aquimarina]|uniref:Metalloregulator ArsR/SmtB family transcription factor n=1 Tax=Salinisphaera aquimarina TaxID=2094031 RepID=A0ABV7EQN0_9GAMM